MSFYRNYDGNTTERQCLPSCRIAFPPAGRYTRISGPLTSAYIPCTDPESFVRGSNFFFLMRGERIQIPLKAGHHWPASETPFTCTPFKWRFASSYGTLTDIQVAAVR